MNYFNFKTIKMKKNLLLAFTFVAILATAQVSTTPENKNAVLEEFTGISCGFCPDGHKIAQDFHDANPGDVVLINIHTGSYATPQGPGTDFNTAFGAALSSQSGVCGFPAGTMNRIDFTSNGWNQTSQNGCVASTAMSRDKFVNAGNVILSESSPVNVWGNAIVDLGTGQLTVDVEVYFTGNQSVSTNKIHVAVLQNNIEGPQSGSSANPAGVLPNGNYNHQHMLRHLLTGQWGQTLSTISQGTSFADQFVWSIPTDINGVEVDPTNLEVAIFISEGNEGILTGEMADLTVNFPNTDDAKFSSSIASNLTCSSGTTNLSVDFQNYGSTALTSLDIEYSINGGAINTYPWTGNVASAGYGTVSIPNVTVSANATNTVNFTLKNPNGVADQNTANNSQIATFNGVSTAIVGGASIEVKTDNYGSETTWTLKDASGTTIASGGPYPDNSAVQQAPVTADLVDGNCYTFTIMDSYGDGILSPGNYRVRDANGTILAWGGTVSSNGNFTSEEKSYFQVGSVIANINETISNISIYPNPAKDILTINGDYETVKIYDIFGKLVVEEISKNPINVSTLANGVYILNINTRNTISTNKITISK